MGRSGSYINQPTGYKAFRPLTANEDHGYAIDEAEVVYWGVCPECSIATSA